MKRRVFYVIHLDRNRILFLFFTFVSLLLFSFALGSKIRDGMLLEKTNPNLALKGKQGAQENNFENSVLDLDSQEPSTERLPVNQIDKEMIQENKKTPYLGEELNHKSTKKEERVEHFVLENSTPPSTNQAYEEVISTPTTLRPTKIKTKKQQLVLKKNTKKKKEFAEKSEPKKNPSLLSEKKGGASKNIATQTPIEVKGRKEIKTNKSGIDSANQKSTVRDSGSINHSEIHMANVPSPTPLKSNKQEDKGMQTTSLNKKDTPTPTTIESSKQEVYELQLGAFQSKSAAERMRKELKNRGYEAVIVIKNNIHQVKIKNTNQGNPIEKIEEQLRKDKFTPVKKKELKTEE